MWLSGLLVKFSSLHPNARETNENLTKCVSVCHWSTGLFIIIVLTVWFYTLASWAVCHLDWYCEIKNTLGCFLFFLKFFSASNCFPHRQQLSAISSNSDDYICKRSVSVTQKDWQTVLWALMHSLYITCHTADTLQEVVIGAIHLSHLFLTLSQNPKCHLPVASSLFNPKTLHPPS